MAIYDTMQYIRCDVSTICVGMAASMGAFLLSSGAKGKRFALPNSEIMIHQPSGGARGQATDCLLYTSITGADKAEGRIQIPGTGGRDLMDLEFSQKGNVELMSALDSLYADSGVAHDIWPGPASVCTILEDGYARWFKTGEAAGKTMTADLPEKGAFYVYDENLSLIHIWYLPGYLPWHCGGGSRNLYSGDSYCRDESGWITCPCRGSASHFFRD